MQWHVVRLLCRSFLLPLVLFMVTDRRSGFQTSMAIVFDAMESVHFNNRLKGSRRFVDCYFYAPSVHTIYGLVSFFPCRSTLWTSFWLTSNGRMGLKLFQLRFEWFSIINGIEKNSRKIVQKKKNLPKDHPLDFFSRKFVNIILFAIR